MLCFSFISVSFRFHFRCASGLRLKTCYNATRPLHGAPSTRIERKTEEREREVHKPVYHLLKHSGATKFVMVTLFDQ